MIIKFKLFESISVAPKVGDFVIIESKKYEKYNINIYNF